jgi:hypothetical protein
MSAPMTRSRTFFQRKYSGAGIGIGTRIAPENAPVEQIRFLNNQKNLAYFSSESKDPISPLTC